jgi:hypothetical protein
MFALVSANSSPAFVNLKCDPESALELQIATRLSVPAITRQAPMEQLSNSTNRSRAMSCER